MRRRTTLLVAAATVLGAIGSGYALAGNGSSTSEEATSTARPASLSAGAGEAAGPETDRATAARKKPLKFDESELFIEINGTDGDAGLQMALDGEDWRTFSLFAPNGKKILGIDGKSKLRGYGLTGVTFESAEPAFDEVPLRQFKKRFPEGKYTFRGETVDGRRLTGSDRLTHDIPRMPIVTSPLEDAVVDGAGFVVAWEPVTRPVGIEIELYQVIVSAEDRDGTIEAELPPAATSLSIPTEFLLPGAYKVEVLAKEASGNQIITEIPFSVQ